MRYAFHIFFLIFLNSVVSQATSNCKELEKKLDNIYTTNTKDFFAFSQSLDTLIPQIEAAECWHLTFNAYYYLERTAVREEEFSQAKILLERTDSLLNISKYRNSITPKYRNYLLFNHQNNHGNFYYSTGRFQEAENLYLQMIEQYHDTFKIYTKDVFVTAYHYLSKVYEKQMRLIEAQQELEKSLELARQVGGGKLCNTYKLIGDVLIKISEKDQVKYSSSLQKAKEYYQKALKCNSELFEKKYDEKIPSRDVGIINRIIHAYLGLANLNSIQGKLDSNKKHLREAEKYLKAAEKHLQYDKSQEIDIIERSGDIHEREDKYELAINAYQKVLQRRLTTFGKHHPKVAEVNIKLGKCYLGLNDFDKANKYFTKAEETLKESDISFMTSQKLLTELNQSKGDYYLRVYRSSQEKNYLLKSYNSYKEAITYLQALKVFHYLTEDQANLIALHSELFDNVIQTAYELGEEYWEEAFYYAEQAKAVKLQSLLNHSDALTASNVSPEKQAQERELKIKIAELRKKVFQTRLKDNQSSSIMQDLSENEQALKELIDSYRIDDPIYFEQHYQIDSFSLQDIRSKFLNKETALIEYHVTNSTTYLWSLSEDHFKMYRLNEPAKTVTEAINELTDQMINNSDKREKTRNRLYTLYSNLYEYLLGKVTLPTQINNLIIVPDGAVRKLPFDILSSPVKEQTYLIEKYNISYAHSASTLLRQSNKTAINHKYRLGTFVNKGVTQPLVNIENILNKLAPRHNFTNVTPAVCKQKLDLYDVVIIGAHSQLNYNNPYYSSLLLASDAQSDGRLTFLELQALTLSTRLFVLLNCETIRDDSTRTEDSSLAHAINYAGVSNFVAAAWEIPDEQTAKIIQYFHQFLKTGYYTSAEALRAAKLKYLKETSDTIGRHPFFWGAMVYYGVDSSIYQPSFWDKILHWLRGKK